MISKEVTMNTNKTRRDRKSERSKAHMARQNMILVF